MPVSKSKTSATKRVARPYSFKAAKSKLKISEGFGVYLKAAPKELEQFGTFADSNTLAVLASGSASESFIFRNCVLAAINGKAIPKGIIWFLRNLF